MTDQDNTIPLATAKTWTAEWRSEESNYNNYHTCNGFLVPAEDLQNVLDEIKGQTGDKKIRVYLGVKTDNSTIPPTQTEKLLIVGTIAEIQDDGSVIYRDIINGTVDGKGAAPLTNSGIWDFSEPCPPVCDHKSPLN